MKNNYLHYVLILIGAFSIFPQHALGQATTQGIESKDSVNLNEVVVVGYGTQTRKQLTKAVSSIKGEDIERLAPVSMSVQDLLGSGLAKGVLSIQNSGEPGAAPTINVRGVTSPYPNWTTGTLGNAPLYVIDGIPTFVESTSLNPLLNISPNDIESIDILKDAAATAIYGSRGANGVIMIKTKEGRKNMKPTVSFGYSLAVANPIKRNDVLNNAEFRQLHHDMLRNGVTAFNEGFVWDDFPFTFFADLSQNFNEDGSYTLGYNGLLNDAFGNSSINWEKELENSNATTHQYNVAVRGGSASTVYSFSLHGSNQEGLYKKDGLDVYGGRMSIATDVNKYLKLGLSASYSETKREFAITDDVPWYTRPLAYRPDFPVFNADGTYSATDEIGQFGGSGLFTPNPVSFLEQKNSHENNQLTSNLFAEARIIDGLKFRFDFGHTNYKFASSYFLPAVAQWDFSVFGMVPEASLETKESKYMTTTMNFQLDYQLEVGKHSLKALAGYGTERNRNSIVSMKYEGFPNDELLNNVGSAQMVYGQRELIQKNGLNSVFTRVNYGYDNKYFGEVSFRADASSRFGPDNQWGYFPALSGAWVVSREGFMKKAKWLDNLKLRASVGQTGSTNIDDFSYKQYYTANGQYNGGSAVVLEDLLPNRGIRWEKTTEYNLGLDFSLFKHRLYGNIDLYTRKTDGALAPTPHILESGLNSFFDNIIDLTNRGFELSIGADVIRTRDFTWNTMLNISSNKSKIDNLNNAQINEDLQDAFVVGYPVGTVKGYVVDHIVQDRAEIDALNAVALEKYDQEYQSMTSVGDYLYKDLDGNGIIDESDRAVIANPEPKFFGSWFNQFSYKNFSLSFALTFSQGGEAVYSQLQEDACSLLGHSVSREMYGNYWTPEHTDAKYARVAAFLFNNNMSLNDRYVFSTSYLRMKNITLSYRIPAKALSKLQVGDASVFVSATNLFTISSWPGIDPETLTAGVTYMGRNNDPYPLSRSISMGINLQF